MREVVLDWWEYLEGQRCARAAWFHHRQREEGARPSFRDLEERERLRQLAQQRWPLGQDTWMVGPTEADRDERTRRLVARGCPAIFRASVTAAGATVVVDILERTAEGGWIAILLSSRTLLTPAQVETAALTLHVLKAAAVPVAAIHLLHVDAAFRKGPGPVEPERFFVRRSVTIRAARAEPRVKARVEATRSMLEADEMPDVPTGSHCRSCAFASRCVAMHPADWTGRFPFEEGPSPNAWIAQGYARMADVPASEVAGPRRRLTRQASCSGRIAVAPSLPDALAALGPPAFYLDFECLVSLVPLFEGDAPGQHVPFLWSLHHVDATGQLTHWDHIVAPGDDPRRECAEALIEALGASTEPIATYGDYEALRLLEVEARCADLAPALRTMRERIVDMLALVRGHVYDLQFQGSYSLKSIAPVLAPGITWRGLAIKDGAIAARAYTQLVQSPPDADQVRQTLRDLRQYCARDTLALVDVHRALTHLADGVRTAATVLPGGT